jgi:hypothetical protein
MNLTTKPYGHFITGRYLTDEDGSAFVEITSERHKQKVRFDRDTQENVNDQIGQWLEDNGHSIIAWSETNGKYIFICTPVKPLS